MIKTSINRKNSKFLNSFSNVIKNERIDQSSSKNKINLFVLNSDANDFDYENYKRNTENHIIEFVLPRKYIRKLKDNDEAITLVREAQSKFVKKGNIGEIGELLLFCFLEVHLGAPKILSKMELKTSNNMYVNGSDGVHLLKLENGNYQLIYGEAKMKNDLTESITEAFKSIDQFKREVNDKDDFKSGLPLERSVISSNLSKEFSEEEESFVIDLIYPTHNDDEDRINLDSAFAIFVAYDFEITEDDRKLENDEFRKLVNLRIETKVRSKFSHISKKINDYKLWGHNFHIYVLPFSNLNVNRKKDTHF